MNGAARRTSVHGRDGSKPMSGSHKRDTVEPGHPVARVQFTRNELVSLVASPIELASRTALIQNAHQIASVPPPSAQIVPRAQFNARWPAP